MLAALPADTPPDDDPKGATTTTKPSAMGAGQQGAGEIPKVKQSYNEQHILKQPKDTPTPAEAAEHAKYAPPADFMNPAESTGLNAAEHGAHHPEDVKYKGYAKDHKGMSKSHGGRDSHK